MTTHRGNSESTPERTPIRCYRCNGHGSLWAGEDADGANLYVPCDTCGGTGIRAVVVSMSDGRLNDLRTAANVMTINAARARNGFDATHGLFAYRVLECINEIERLRAVIAGRDAEIARLEMLFNQMIHDADPERFDFDSHRMAAWVVNSALNAFAGKKDR